MFKNCKNLEYLNLSRANFQTANNAGGIFSGTRNLVICSKCNKIKSIIANSNCIIIDCSSNWRLNQKRLNTENNECVPNCANINYKYNYLSKCFNFFQMVPIMIIIYVKIVIQIVNYAIDQMN